MITKIQNTIFAKPITLVVAFSLLTMSFKMQGDGEVILNAGTGIILETLSPIRSDKLMIGQPVDFRVARDVIVDGHTVIAAGTLAQGQVLYARKARWLGREGRLEIQLKSVQAIDGQNVFLSGGNIYREGENFQVLLILLGVLVFPPLILIKGKNAEIPPGYQVSSAVATTVTVRI